MAAPIPRAAPVLASPLTCPVCQALVHEVTVREGQAWLRCGADLRSRPGRTAEEALSGPRRPCGAHWLNITLPGNRPAVDALRARYGAEIADALADAGGPSFRAAPDPVPGHPVVHVQVLTTPRVEHVFRFVTLSGILRVLGIMAPTPAAP